MPHSSAAAASPAPAATVGQRSSQQQCWLKQQPVEERRSVRRARRGTSPTGMAFTTILRLLAEAARCIEAQTPWYETLYEEVADGGGDLAVDTILTFSVMSSLIEATNETVLAPVFVALKGLLGAVQGAAAAREEIVELIRYCVGISRCLLEAAKVEHMPRSIVVSLEEFKGEIEAMERFVYGTRPSGCCRRMVLSSYDRDTAAGHKRKLKGLLDAVLAGLAVQTNQAINELEDMIRARDPPPLAAMALIPREAPISCPRPTCKGPECLREW